MATPIRLAAQRYSTWMHQGSAVKVFAIANPPIGGAEVFWQSTLSFQTSLSPHWALDFTLAAGKPMDDIYYLPFIASWLEARRYLCRSTRPFRNSHAFVPFYLGYRRNIQEEWDNNGIQYNIHPWWLGAGSGIGMDIHLLKRFNLELEGGIAFGREQLPYPDSPYSRTMTRPRLRVQLVIPLAG